MRHPRTFAVCLLALAPCLAASTIDVSAQASVTLRSGDTLNFLFSWSSYANFAAASGLSPDPASVNFTFTSQPVSATGQFTADLQSTTGASSAAFPGTLAWAPGYLTSSAYTGIVSALTDTVSLSPALSQSVFAGPEAELVLTYTGADISVGVQGRTIRQDLQVSLIGNGVSVGGMVYSAALDPPTAFGPDLLISNALPVSAPEPSAALLVAAGATLCALAGILRRFRARAR
jgi:hypothetical protein